MSDITIPYQLRTRLLHLEPSLDFEWERDLRAILAETSDEYFDTIDFQILKPKNILWDRDADQFRYKPDNDVQALETKFLNKKMRYFAATFSLSLSSLKELKDPLQIADFLEGALEQINQIEVGEDFQMQREKLELRRTFLLNAAEIIRNTSFELQPTLRELTDDKIKCFMIEVFIKQQLLGYWFKPLLRKETKEMKHPLFRYFLIKEQKIRHFDIVRTSQYLFIVAPVMDAEQNPYSIRRFLIEEKGALENQIYLNVLVLDLKDDMDEAEVDTLKTHMQRMVTLQSQIHLDVIDIVEELRITTEQKIIPLLVEPIQVVEKNADVVAQRHLKLFEEILTRDLLLPIRAAIKDHLSHIEEFNYLYLHVHRAFSEILGCYSDFKSQPAFTFNEHIQSFEYKLLGFLHLLEKRKPETFIPLNRHEWEVMHQRSEAPLRALQETIAEHVLQYRELKKYIFALNRQQVEESKKSFFKKIWKKDTTALEIEQAKKRLEQIHRKLFLEIIQIPRTHERNSVFLEFDTLQGFQEVSRHYAFPCGDNGMTRLPILIHLPATYDTFDIEQFNASISLDLNFSAGSRIQSEADQPISFE